jgi:hypothetical protein
MPGALCRDCGRKLRWVPTEKGRRMPLDDEPDPNGNVVMRNGKAHVLTAAELTSRATDPTRWTPHAATCPNSRGRRRG